MAMPYAVTTMELVRSYPDIAGNLHVPTAIVYAGPNRRAVTFYETVALNRGYPTRIFPDIEPAAGWLDGGR